MLVFGAVCVCVRVFPQEPWIFSFQRSVDTPTALITGERRGSDLPDESFLREFFFKESHVGWIMMRGYIMYIARISLI